MRPSRAAWLSCRLELRGREGVAVLDAAALQAAVEPAGALGRSPMGEGVRGDVAAALLLQLVVPHRRSGAQGLVDVAGLQHLVLRLVAVGPDPRVAVRLQLQPYRTPGGAAAAGRAGIHGP